MNDLLDLSASMRVCSNLALGEFDVRDVIEDVMRVSIDSAEKKQRTSLVR